ncbi:MAG: hypothetical protein GC154_20315 [bacterium]|nr:hypothetical protein [bacterium]
MNFDYAIASDKRKRNFVGVRIDDLLHERIESEAQRREITLSDAIRRLCLERLDGLGYDGEAARTGTRVLSRETRREAINSYEYRIDWEY